MIPLLTSYEGSDAQINDELFNKLNQIISLDTPYTQTINAIRSLKSTEVTKGTSAVTVRMYLQPGAYAYVDENATYKVQQGGIITFPSHSPAPATIALSDEQSSRMDYILSTLSHSFDISFDRFGRRSSTDIATTIHFQGNIMPSGIGQITYSQNGSQKTLYNFNKTNKSMEKQVISVFNSTNLTTYTFGQCFEYSIESDLRAILPAAVEMVSSAFVSR